MKKTTKPIYFGCHKPFTHTTLNFSDSKGKTYKINQRVLQSLTDFDHRFVRRYARIAVGFRLFIYTFDFAFL